MKQRHQGEPSRAGRLCSRPAVPRKMGLQKVTGSEQCPRRLRQAAAVLRSWPAEVGLPEHLTTLKKTGRPGISPPWAIRALTPDADSNRNGHLHVHLQLPRALFARPVQLNR